MGKQKKNTRKNVFKNRNKRLKINARIGKPTPQPNAGVGRALEV